MPDENRFARLGEAIGESADENPDAEEADEAVESESDASPPAESTPEPEPESDEVADANDDTDADDEPETPADESAEPDHEEGDSPDEPAGGPAFEFEETTAKSVYVRPETVAVLDDAEFEVESHLRREHDVRDVTGREFHDAVVRVAAEHPEEVAEAILDARDGDE